MSQIEILEFKDLKQAFREIGKTGADAEGVKIMSPKAVHRSIRIKDVSMPASQILKEEMLSLGADAARSRGSLVHADKSTDVILFGTLKQYKRLCKKLAVQPFGLKQLASEIDKCLRNYDSVPHPILLPSGKKLEFEDRTLIMGIINTSPDSFSGDGMELNIASIVNKAMEFNKAGADIIDIGGESTRPGAEPIEIEEEIKRTVPVIRTLSKELPIPISIDTYKKQVAETTIEAGAEIINDITGFHHDPEMSKLAARTGVAAILMHIKGTPRNMQDSPQYYNLMAEISSYLTQGLEIAAYNGMKEEQIIIDPGIGFGKTIEHNFQILNNLKKLKGLGRPIMVGTSRKSFIGKILDKDPEQRIYGSIATVAASVLNGANIVRVHDVRETADAVKLIDRIKTAHG